MYNRFDLEDAMSKMLDIENEIEDLIYRIGDHPDKATEDNILNVLIGLNELNNTRYTRMWTIFESLIKQGTIKDTQNEETS